MVLLILIAVILGLFSIKLFDLQIIETDGNTDNTTTYTSITRVKAARGDILDRNGNILVGNRASYDLVFNHFVITSADGTNEYLYKLLATCRELGIEYTDRLPISKERPFTYTLDEYNTTWQGYFQSYLVDRSIDSDISAPLLIQWLRDRYKIPEEWTDTEARAVIGLRYEFDLRGVITSLSNYIFIEDVSDENLSILLELNIPGLMVESSTVREYYTSYAAHILGSVGAIDADEADYYEDLGYAMDAYVGKSGFESAFESDLHATDGTRIDVVAKDGTIISQTYAKKYDSDGNVIGEKSPQAGSNVETTIDLNIQIAAEDALAEIMEYLVDKERNVTSTGKPGDGQDAEGAAVVVMKTNGEILACASYPTYNLATFNQDYATLKDDPLKPMYNRATMAAYPPGSTYKMCMVVSGIMNQKISSSSTIHDNMVFDKYAGSDGFAPVCLYYTNAGRSHGDLTAAEALMVSCNYFFYELADRLDIEDMDATAKGLGLGEATGIELPENLGYRANPENKALMYASNPSQSGFYTADRIVAGIGQSINKFTPMQLAVYIQTLANQGVRYKATFLSRVVSADYSTLVSENKPQVLSTMDISDDAYYAYVQGMRLVITGNDTWKGTGGKYFGGPQDVTSDGTWDHDIAVCAKTGTAETIKDGRSDNGAYVCFAPMDDPEIVVVVYGERVAHGSTLGIVAEKILNVYFSNASEASDVSAQENRLN